MIRYLFVLHLALVSVLLIDPNPLYALPLVLVLLGFIFDRKWPGILGIIGFSIITVGNLSSVNLNEFPVLILHFALIMIPMLILLEIILSPAPYRLERISIGPLLISISLLVALFITLFLLTRIQRVGIYVNSEPILQVFILISLSIFFLGPPLLSNNQSGEPERSAEVQNGYNEPNE